VNFSKFVLAMVGVVVVSAGLSRAQPFTAFNISNDAANSINARTDGRYVVWSSLENGDVDVLGRDLLLGQPLTVANTSALEGAPAISNGTVVWEEFTPGTSSSLIRGRSLPAGAPFVVTNNPLASAPSISGNLVVWQQADGPLAIWGRRLNQPIGSDFQISGAAAFDQQFPDVDGDTVVWESFMEPGGDVGNIYGRRLSVGGAFPITTNPENQHFARISGENVVWMDSRDGGSRIYGKNLVTGVEFPISSADFSAESPAIDGDLVVWKQNNADFSETDIYGRFLSGGDAFPITNTAGIFEDRPDVIGNLVVWQQSPTGADNEIWGTYVPEPGSAAMAMMIGIVMLARRRGRGQ
jgi:beta propeller repeat protein